MCRSTWVGTYLFFMLSLLATAWGDGDGGGEPLTRSSKGC